jgi:prepilin-type N-terminal cleavage/methylation domain-containing protein
MKRHMANSKWQIANGWSKGFTLIEIVLVIALIGLTSTLLISLVNPVQQFKKANDAQRKADLRQLQAVLELYRADQGQYPAALPACGSALTSGTVTYLRKVPCDPKNTGQFRYNYTATTNTYTLTACLENVRDPQRDLAPTFPAGNNALRCTGGTTNRSYTLNNP